MATFIGTTGDDIITPGFVSAGVVASGGSRPGNGADTIFGGLGADTIDSGGGDDLVFGGDGNDVAFLGAGNDRFVWNPGDDNDTVEGQAGFDTFELNGANVGEAIDISANGARARVFRDVANVTIDLDGVERIEYDALGGADRVMVGNLAGTAVREVAVDLAAAAGGGDAQADEVRVNGTGGNDKIVVSGSGGSATVQGLTARIDVMNGETLDQLVIVGGGGNDTIDTSAYAGNMALIVLGGAGNDIFMQSARSSLTVMDFELGADRIQLAGVKAADLDRADLAAGMRQVGAELHLDLGDGQIVLKNVSLADIGSAADLFG